ncbi:MAG: hypothetical protein WCC28_23175 [Mycobacterium sp.]|uniref:hypothetical protein n=1 Tax=Mycobacterium sp. TaxID=1785 RepID=UPI003C71B45B
MRTSVAEELGAESTVGPVGHRCPKGATAPAASGLAGAQLVPGAASEFIYLVRSFDELVDG